MTLRFDQTETEAPVPLGRVNAMQSDAHRAEINRVAANDARRSR